MPGQVQALYERGEELAAWWRTEDGKPAPAIRRHHRNDRCNGVARDRYACLVEQHGLLAEMRAPPP